VNKAIIGALALAASTAACTHKPVNRAHEFGLDVKAVFSLDCRKTDIHPRGYEWCYSMPRHTWSVWIVSSYEETPEQGPYVYPAIIGEYAINNAN
jgi:hypothetical protein